MPQNIEFSPENNLSFLTREAYNSIGPVIKCLAWENFELDSLHKTQLCFSHSSSNVSFPHLGFRNRNSFFFLSIDSETYI